MLFGCCWRMGEAQVAWNRHGARTRKASAIVKEKRQM